MWVTDTATDCEEWAYLPVVGVRTLPSSRLENYSEKTKKSKFRDWDIYIFPMIVSFFFLSAKSQLFQGLQCQSFQPRVQVYPALSRVELFDMVGIN